MTSLLSIRHLSSGYGSYGVLQDLSLEVRHGQIVTVVGPNGAGKSTLLRSISGHADRFSGQIIFDGGDLAGMAAHDRSRVGLVHVPEGRRLFPDLTVQQTLRVGSSFPRVRARRDENIDKVRGLFPRLAERWNLAAGNLSGGEQQMLAIGRALMAEPRLLMLDEPSLGLAPLIVDGIYDRLSSLAGDGLSLLIVEQNVTRSLEVAEYAYVLEAGRVAMQGHAAALVEDYRLAGVYLKGGDDA